ncbi:AAA family ATPase [Candidatus Micrarchaeota archaeon]|nr:AAA family ATPase [Candidatus Micrarchaeota archaeon]
MIIGLTGENCAGKGTVAEYLKKKSFYYHSLSDVLREILKEQGIENTRDNLITKGNLLREALGPGVLGKLIAQKLQDDKNYVIDSIRNPEEAKELKKIEGFFLIHVSAPQETRFERIRLRKREGDPETLEEFRRTENLELENKDNNKQNLKGTAGLADKKIVNDGTIEELHKKVDGVLAGIPASFKFSRPSWDAYFMKIAKVVASRSNCIKRKVAAVIVKDKRIISTGYNGTPRGTKNCSEGGCPRCNSFADGGKSLEDCYCSHGEENAIVQASYHGISIKDSTIYTTFSPCLLCTKMILNAGIREVVYNADYPLGEVPLKLLKEAGIEVRQYKID